MTFESTRRETQALQPIKTPHPPIFSLGLEGERQKQREREGERGGKAKRDVSVR